MQSTADAKTGAIPLSSEVAPGRSLNRELSWLDWNRRVLALAGDPTQRLLERAKYLAIVSTNLDEFFQVRVAGLRAQVDAGVKAPASDGRTPREQLNEIRVQVQEQLRQQEGILHKELLPALAERGIRLTSYIFIRQFIFAVINQFILFFCMTNIFLYVIHKVF